MISSAGQFFQIKNTKRQKNGDIIIYILYICNTYMQ